MYKILLKSKIHRAKVTDANLEYEGSISIDEDLLEKAHILPYEKVNIWDINNGNRLETYAIPSVRHSGDVIVNGAASRLVRMGDIIIIATFGLYDENELNDFKPALIYVDEKNRIKDAVK
ncbi:aspartate 1-decarboxylase [Candidatus Acidulodesulfobacterium sp. H_13]|uniref:aspartate 1-decarboxylase n=1 Tax=Candidatus Acidulodesulfobacterium sp. H_13 TaxID=3395470 RepID=UPI003AF8DA2E